MEPQGFFDWMNYFDKMELTILKCKECQKTFTSALEAYNHLTQNHEIKIELKVCIRCGNSFMEEIPGQLICASQKCLFPENAG